ncbi:hypothetical protein GCM10010304_81330 [Streptomyces roseoviolaceus]
MTREAVPLPTRARAATASSVARRPSNCPTASSPPTNAGRRHPPTSRPQHQAAIQVSCWLIPKAGLPSLERCELAGGREPRGDHRPTTCLVARATDSRNRGCVIGQGIRNRYWYWGRFPKGSAAWNLQSIIFQGWTWQAGT